MLRLHHDGVSAREIGRTLGVARSTIQDNLRRAQACGIGWPVPAELTDDILEQRLFARGGTKAGRRRRSEPDWGTLARELKGVRPTFQMAFFKLTFASSSPTCPATQSVSALGRFQRSLPTRGARAGPCGGRALFTAYLRTAGGDR